MRKVWQRPWFLLVVCLGGFFGVVFFFGPAGADPPAQPGDLPTCSVSVAGVDPTTATSGAAGLVDAFGARTGTPVPLTFSDLTDEGYTDVTVACGSAGAPQFDEYVPYGGGGGFDVDVDDGDVSGASEVAPSHGTDSFSVPSGDDSAVTGSGLGEVTVYWVPGSVDGYDSFEGLPSGVVGFAFDDSSNQWEYTSADVASDAGGGSGDTGSTGAGCGSVVSSELTCLAAVSGTVFGGVVVDVVLGLLGLIVVIWAVCWLYGWLKRRQMGF